MIFDDIERGLQSITGYSLVPSLREAQDAAGEHDLPINLGDYWRDGEAPPKPLRFVTSSSTLNRLRGSGF